MFNSSARDEKHAFFLVRIIEKNRLYLLIMLEKDKIVFLHKIVFVHKKH